MIHEGSGRFWSLWMVAALLVTAGTPTHADIYIGGDTADLLRYDLTEFSEFPGNRGDAFATVRNSTIGITFGEKLIGQVNDPYGNFDVISGIPAVPLTMDTSVDPIVGINLLFFNQATVIDGLGKVGFPSLYSIGSGALTILYDLDQRVIAFDVVGASGGEFDIQFFSRSADLLEYITIPKVANGTYTFSSDVADIAAITLQNFDHAGIGFTSLRLTPLPPSETPICEAGGPYRGVAQDGATQVFLEGHAPDGSAGEAWDSLWITDCPGGYFDDNTSPQTTLFIDPNVPCGFECSVTLLIGDAAQGIVCTTAVTAPGGTTITCPPDLTVECDRAVNEAELDDWLSGASGDQGEVLNNFEELSWSCGPSGSATVTFSGDPDDDGECGPTTPCSATFAVEDTTPPVLVFESTYLEVVDTDCDGEEFATLPNVTAEDACAEDLLVTDDAPESFPAGQVTTVTFTAVDECENVASATIDVAVLYGASIEVEVVERPSRAGRHRGGAEVPLVGIVVSAFDRSRDSCVREQIRASHGLRKEGFEAIHTYCEPVATAQTDENGFALLAVPPGTYMLVALVGDEGDPLADRYLGKPVGQINCQEFKTRRLRLQRGSDAEEDDSDDEP